MTDENTQLEIQTTLTEFIRHFNNLAMDAVAAHFSAEATLFPRTVMSPAGNANIFLENYLREDGPAPFTSMETFASELRGSSAGPPFMALQPEDTKIQVYGDAAIVTFHLRNDVRLARRTLVLVKEVDAWKIAHLHASNVQLQANAS